MTINARPAGEVPGPEQGDPMMEALEGERIEEGLNGDPLTILKERNVTGYVMISGIDESADAALISIEGEVVGAEYLSDDGRWLGKDALDRIKHLQNTWIDLFTWDRKSLERVMGTSPKAKIAMTKEDLRAVIEERRKRRLEALRTSKTSTEKGRGLTGLFAKVSEQVKGLEAPPDAHVEEELPPEVAELHTIEVEPPVPTPEEPDEPDVIQQLRAVVGENEPRPLETDGAGSPTLLSRPPATTAPEASPEPEAEGAPAEGEPGPESMDDKSFEEAISEGIDELKQLSKELDGLLDE